MGDERIPGLPDLVGDETVWSFIMDKEGETSAVKVPFIIGMQSIQSQITDNKDDIALKADKSNVLERDNAADYIPSTDYNPATKKWVDEGGLRIAQAAAAKNLVIINDADSNCVVSYSSAMIHISGTIQIDVTPIVGETLFTIPSQFPVFATDWFLPAVDSSVTNANNELKCVAGTRNIVNFSASPQKDAQGVFSANIPAFITGT